MRWMGVCVVSALALGCTPWDLRDSDGDGLLNGDEELLGTDPRDPDSDGDGLTDWEEVCVYFSNPVDPDTSGNGFTDLEEVEAGTPPTNPYIFPLEQGNYLLGDAPFPAEATEPSATGPWNNPRFGPGDIPEPFPSFDAYGQDLDLYSFQGRYIYLIFSAEWCGPCRNLAAQLSSIQEQYPDLAIVEVLVENHWRQDPDVEDLMRWHNDFDLDGIATMADPGREQWMNFADVAFFPTMTVLDPNMEIVHTGYITNPGPYISDDWGSEPPKQALPESCNEPPPE